jgi:hypothetical protein
MGQGKSKGSKSKRESTRDDEFGQSPSKHSPKIGEAGDDDDVHPSWNDEMLFNDGDNQKYVCFVSFLLFVSEICFVCVSAVR